MCATTILFYIASTPPVSLIIDSILRPTHLDHFIPTLKSQLPPFHNSRSQHQQEEDHTSFKQHIVDMANSSSWSPENATKAYLGALKMGKRGREPDVAEFISALAAGNNAQLMVEICSTEKAAGVLSTTLALVAAAQQTGGRVVCIFPSDTQPEELKLSTELLGPHSSSSGRVELVAGDPQSLLLDNYIQADFILFDCHANCLRDLAQRVEAQSSGGSTGPLLVGYNALDKAGVPWTGTGRAGGVLVKGLHYSPIGSGLVVGKVGGGGENKSSMGRSKWVVRVDKCTGEEHVFRIVSPHHKSSTVQA